MARVAQPVRSDAARNREALIEVATRLFAAAAGGDEPSLRLIAREAGVGVGTLFRHFPTREALVEAVYQDQVRRLTEGADQLLANHPPAQAMRRWMDLFTDWLATKHGMLGTLRAMINNEQLGSGHTRIELLAAIDKILAAGRAAGDIGDHISSEDVAAGLIGIFTVAPTGGNSEQATRLLDIFMNGLSAPQSTVRTTTSTTDSP
ncbi:TetR/AcrR family transcriptional regulator [Mycobacterium avium]|uniref:TetR/AcrR family transcriptional regulator n=1 Tax=Mycobacterium avium subsp. hominissuis TaxID=439334 RepID=A0A3B6X8J4_MYCAV|nr:TetR/AcrR family transcriptional regulator [Mycobacterium avium]AXO23490.1 TetR/AcrR family transcriptional regulator [Mycobacterium avium subsp. hominissuis]PBA72107.1 TetR/AcrR family transcriptional regulator [Mycobacterium avium]